LADECYKETLAVSGGKLLETPTEIKLIGTMKSFIKKIVLAYFESCVITPGKRC
jgi:hypothetical protein